MANRIEVPDDAESRPVNVELPNGVVVTGLLFTPDLVVIPFPGERFHLYDQVVVDGRKRRIHGHLTEIKDGTGMTRLDLAPLVEGE